MSTLSQFAPFAGGGLKSFQTGFLSSLGTVGSFGEDRFFLDITISSVSTAKSISTFQGTIGTNNQSFYTGGYSTSAIVTSRLTSTTNLRLGNPVDGFNYNGLYFTGRWQVAEAN